MFSVPQHTQIPNKVFDELIPTLKEGELRTLLVIMRQTYGWHKEWDRISITFLMKKTGMCRQSVCIAVKNLIKKGMIKKEKFGQCGTEKVFYSLCLNDGEKHGQNEPNIEIDSNILYQSTKETPPSLLSRPTKETITKEIIIEKVNQKEDPPTPKGGDPNSFSLEGSKESSAKQAISEEAKELVSYVQEKVQRSNANAISLTTNQLTRERKAAQSLLIALTPHNSAPPPSLKKALATAKEVVDRTFTDNFWKNKLTSVGYLKNKWNQLSNLSVKKFDSSAHQQKNPDGTPYRSPILEHDFSKDFVYMGAGYDE